nr:MAG TPA: hypothetical protein [Caudoviricetes sp.]
MKDRIGKWYKMGLWTKDMVRSAVVKGKLTADEYAEITGEAYGEV